MTDRFKFRVWDKKSKIFIERGLIDIYLGVFLTDNLLNKSRFLIEQCTGLKDKNGKLIYEGDIIFINGEKWLVIWDDENCAFFFSNLKEEYHQPIFPDFYMGAEDFKVIGNIHENKELLK